MFNIIFEFAHHLTHRWKFGDFLSNNIAVDPQRSLSFFGQALNNTSERSEVSLWNAIQRFNACGDVANARCEIKQVLFHSPNRNIYV